MRRTDEGTTSRKNAGTRRLSFLYRVISPLSASAALRRAIHLNKRSRTAQAFTLFARAAGAGIAEAEYRVGRCYLEGSGVPVSLTESVRWLARAATQDHVEAQWLLAALLIHGSGTSGNQQAIAGESTVASLFSGESALEPDFVAAEKWARRAAEHGSADGQAVLAYILTSGPDAQPGGGAPVVSARRRSRLSSGRAGICTVAGAIGQG
jgi:TPR repeat protein